MKITEVVTTILRTNSLFVRVRTSEGVTGIGECSPMNCRVVKAMVDHALAPLVIGEDARDVDRLWHKMFYGTYKLGVMGAQMEGIAGIDIALWDILGKATGLPVSTLLGGRYRDTIRLYASIGGGAEMSVEQMVGKVEQALAEGFTAIKIRMDWHANRQDRDPDKDFALFARCREIVGPHVPLSFDVNNGYSVPTAIAQGRKMEALGLYHYEEPVAPYDYAGLAQVADALDVPVSAGEHEYTRWQFRDLIEQARVDIVQPDVVKCGGITEMKRIATLAETFNKLFVPHQTQPTIGTAANLHVCAALVNCPRPQEYTRRRPELDDLFVQPLEFENGSMRVPAGPGLGLELDEGRLQALAVP